MSGVKLSCKVSLLAGIVLALPQTALAASGCEALNGTWKGSENPIGVRDSIDTSYQIQATGSKVEVRTGKARGTGECTVNGDQYTLKLNWGKVTSDMTFQLLGADVAMFHWENSAGSGGRGSLTLMGAKE